MIAGITHATGGEDIRSHLQLDGFTAHSKQDIANRVNSALLEPMPDNIPLEVCNALLELNPRKASEPDGIKLWLRQDYADFLTSPVCGILNASFSEHKLSRCWKDADVTPDERKVSDYQRQVGPAVLELIDSDQFGAIPNSSTLHACIPVIHTWLCAWITERPFTW